MPLEIEAKFLDISRTRCREVLTAEGFSCLKTDFLMRRAVFDIPGAGKNTWVRVRDEGDKITLSYKSLHDANSVAGIEEICLVVDDFASARHLLVACGLQEKAYQETRREIWEKSDVEICIDEWPGIPPFIEIEAPTAALVQEIAERLGFNWKSAVFGAVDAVYERYGIPASIINSYPKLTFSDAADVLSLKSR